MADDPRSHWCTHTSGCREHLIPPLPDSVRSWPLQRAYTLMAPLEPALGPACVHAVCFGPLTPTWLMHAYTHEEQPCSFMLLEMDKHRSKKKGREGCSSQEQGKGARLAVALLLRAVSGLGACQLFTTSSTSRIHLASPAGKTVVAVVSFQNPQ